MKVRAIVAIVLVVLILVVLVSPGQTISVAYWVGYAVCHQMPSHSFFMGKHQMPLCARCTGTFLASLVTVLWFLVVKRDRKTLLPPLPIEFVLLAFLAIWALDGLNGTLAELNLFHLYAPGNSIRVVSGLLAGTAIGIFAVYLFNNVVWKLPEEEPLAQNPDDLAIILALDGLLSLMVVFGPPRLVLVLGALGILGVLVLLWMLMLSILLMVVGKVGVFVGWRDLLWAGLAALLAAVLFIVLIDMVRFLITHRLPPAW